MREVIASGVPICVELPQTGRIIGPYYGRSAAIVPCEDLSELEDVPDGFTHEAGVSSMHVLAIDRPRRGLALRPRPARAAGLHRALPAVASAMSDAAEVVVRRGIAQQRLRAENARVAEQLSTDTPDRCRQPLGVGGGIGRSRAPAPLQPDANLGRDGRRRLLAESVRATDVAARIGGDEFGVLVRHTNVEQAQEWLERLTASRVGCSDEGQLLHWSIGCASAEFHETIAAAAAAADREMHEMKSRSRAARR